MEGCIYDNSWYKEISELSYRSGKHTLGYLFHVLGYIPQSIIDIGGGCGAFVSAFYECGIKDVTVVEGDWVKGCGHYVPSSCFRYHNLEEPYFPERSYDLVICCEVAEHLPEAKADVLVDTVVRCGSVCLWSAALPGQGGRGHINEQPEAYWEEKFNARGRIKFDVLRNQLQHEPHDKIAWWYKQNYLIYAL